MEKDGEEYTFNDIKKFDFNNLVPHGFTMTLLASRGGGKTHLTHYLVSEIHKRRKYTAAFLFSNTALIQQDSYPYLPTINKFDNLSLLDEVINRQKDVIEYNKKTKNKKKKRSTILIILDDIISGNQVRKSRTISDLFILGRHIRDKYGSLIDTIILSQHFSGLTPCQRNNNDYILTSRVDSYSDRKALVESYLTVNNSRKNAYAFLKSLNETDFAFLMIWVTKSNKTSITDFTFGFQAPAKLKKFKIGNKKAWLNNQKI
jgi:hypothetical protein